MVPSRHPLRTLASAALDTVFPRRCVACDGRLTAPDAGPDPPAFCPPCALSLEPCQAACGRCGIPLGRASCPDCRRRRPSFAAARAPLLYGGALAEAIVRLKYGGHTHGAVAMAALMLPAADELDARTLDLVVPLPLHASRLRARGFNQAALLARPVARRLGLPIDYAAVRRIRVTAPQADLAPRARFENVEGAFRAAARAVARRRVLLVDDVMTTGATADACARALADAGCAEVRVLTLGRAVP